MKRTLILAALSLVGCAETTPPIPWEGCHGHFAVNAEPELSREAMRRWNAVIGRDHFVEDPDARCQVEWDPEIESDTAFNVFSHNIKLKFPSLGLIMHELGHSEGLMHIATPNSIMSAGVAVDELTEADVAECRRVGLCA